MQRTDFKKLDLSRLPPLCFVVDEVAVCQNLEILADVQARSGAKILGALKAFSMWSLGDLTANYLSGTCSSGLHELQLAHDYYSGDDAIDKENAAEHHCFSAAYAEEDLKKILGIAHTVVFNSFSQWQRFQPLIHDAKQARPELRFGLRINPEHSEGEVPIYDPCAPGSRLGIPLSQFEQWEAEGGTLDGISGLHFHTLCEQDFLPLQRTLAAVEEKFGRYLPDLEWVNFGGGHHITRDDYQRDALVDAIKEFSDRYDVQVYLEPGEAMAIGTGVLVTSVLDVTWNELPQAILNTSATCHMPDTLEMPYRADVTNAGQPDEFPYTYRLGGMTCLAGDVIGDYSFAEPLEIGQRIVFEDMAHYTMVKTTTFNGTKLPAIMLWNSETDVLTLVREFTYDDFKTRLS
ncbi:carboxynorspermidine decarboxylase [Aurantivibrio plasticivorans]